MAEAARIVVIDPDNIPIKLVDNLETIGLVNGLVDLTFSTARFIMGESGRVEHVIAGRLRMTVDVAKALRDHLDRQIRLMSHPCGGAN